ncbi:hypothetical protein [Anaeromicropila herbilytica]|uniref:YceG-like family protein n=1 Tax=Anaeromicropila herbilytica TaxID=2785025 RepID=A0A7R7EMZ1_9FIRM|nr:hypothetical protein [Anaeromicropila herbilytica]BCN31502.1 hypothetical protein bsdtb5_27970 [Anaeromicropila herbilytica]
MKLKYFMRGLGAGIIFTTFILTIFFNTSGARKMSKEEIVKEARNIGMEYQDNNDVDLSALDTDTDNKTVNNSKEKQASNQGNTANSANTNTKSEDNTNSVNKTTTDSKKASANSTSKQTNTDIASNQKDSNNDITSNKNNSKTSEKKTKTDSNSIIIVIKPGMYSSSVAELLVKKGIIDNEKSFLDFLEARDWQQDIRTGEYQIPKQTTLKEIAQMITNH